MGLGTPILILAPPSVEYDLEAFGKPGKEQRATWV